MRRRVAQRKWRNSTPRPCQSRLGATGPAGKTGAGEALIVAVRGGGGRPSPCRAHVVPKHALVTCSASHSTCKVEDWTCGGNQVVEASQHHGRVLLVECDFLVSMWFEWFGCRAVPHWVVVSSPPCEVHERLSGMVWYCRFTVKCISSGSENEHLATISTNTDSRCDMELLDTPHFKVTFDELTRCTWALSGPPSEIKITMKVSKKHDEWAVEEVCVCVCAPEWQ